MENRYTLSKNDRLYCGYDINKLIFIGKGTQGSVYLLPEHKVIKVFKYKDCCMDQLNTLLYASAECNYFPKVYNYDNYSIVMEYIDGIQLDDYLKENKLSRNISYELVKLIMEFKRLGFTKQDIHLFHIFVQNDGSSIRAIDPRKSFEEDFPYPYYMLKGLQKAGVLDRFLHHIKHRYKEVYMEWKQFSNL